MSFPPCRSIVRWSRELPARKFRCASSFHIRTRLSSRQPSCSGANALHRRPQSTQSALRLGPSRRPAFTTPEQPADRFMSILVDKNTKVICQGFTGKNGTFHSSRDRLRHEDGRRHLARQRRHHASRPAGVRYRGEARGRPAATRRDLRAAGRSRPMRSARRSTPRSAHRLHHRGHPGARHGAVAASLSDRSRA